MLEETILILFLKKSLEELFRGIVEKGSAQNHYA